MGSEMRGAVGAVVEGPIGQLRCWPDNPRRISARRLEDLGLALEADREMFRARPLIALLDGTVVCGNMRLRAAQERGWETIPVLFVDLDPGRAKLWALRDNNQWGVWDEPVLAELLAELSADGLELALTGFDGAEIDRLLRNLQGERDPDDLPPLPIGEPDSKVGEVYELGPHLLLNGDCRDPEQLSRLLGGELADVLMTDPPWGVDYVGKTEAALTIRNDDLEGLPSLLRDSFGAVDGVLARSAPFYVFAPAGPIGTEFRLALRQVGWTHHQTLVWVKDSIVLGHSDHHYQHEDVLFGWRPGLGRPGRGRQRGSRWYGANDQSTVFFADRPRRSTEHPISKPVALLEAMLCNSSRHGDVVVDPFAGSGSTLIACERLGRRARLVELDSAYCDVIRRRYQEYRDGGR